MEHLKASAVILLMLILLVNCVFANTNPVVTNLDVSQRKDGKLEISFDIEDEQDDLLSVAIEVSDNNGRTYDVPIGLNSLTGDVGDGIEAGKAKKIVWDAIKDQPNVNSASYRVRITVAERPEGMVLIPVRRFIMGDDNGNPDQQPERKLRRQVVPRVQGIPVQANEAHVERLVVDCLAIGSGGKRQQLHRYGVDGSP